MEKKNIPRVNNFDLIRLIAALQVVFRHTQHHFELNDVCKTIGENFLNYFPGVPIFFCVSGFLIFWSFDRNSDRIKNYFKNRFLRLFPALWLCLIITLILIFNDSLEPLKILKNSQFYLWFIGQSTFFQFWTPDILRFWGVQTPNGSLWTIIVELQFYFLVPVIYFLLSKFKKNWSIYLIFLMSITANIIIGQFGEEDMIYKIGGVSILPYLYNFLLGVLAYIHWDKIKTLVEGKFMLWISIYITYIFFFGNFLGFNLNSYFIFNPFHFITNIILGFVVLSAAFSGNALSNKLLNHNDISYGIYIYHMLVINYFVERKNIGDGIYMFYTFVIVIILSYLSWKFIEKPALQLKKKI